MEPDQNFTQQLLMDMLHDQIYGRRVLNGSDVALVSIYSVIALLSLCGNGFFLFLSFRYRGLRRHISYIMMSLAGSNLLVTCTCLPVSTVKVFYTTWRFGLAGCRLVSFIEGLALSVNSFSLASIAILRARQSALMIPPTQTSTRGLRILVAGTWLSALVVSLPALFAFKLAEVPIPGVGKNATDRVYFVCSEDRSNSAGQKAYSAYLLLILFLSPCIVLTFSYGFTARFISRQFTRLTKNPTTRSQQREAAVAEEEGAEAVELPGVEPPLTTNQTSVMATARLMAGGSRLSGSRQLNTLASSRSPAYQTRKLQKR
uniref:G_PROTEIN_RECEP_F1_2 domain-containing protein n=1 Tax=Macrostomum lignano TaxID=282301 RepID=A0A1I8GA70_9PLAT